MWSGSMAFNSNRFMLALIGCREGGQKYLHKNRNKGIAIVAHGHDAWHLFIACLACLPHHALLLAIH
jgi:hypothetical protein